MSIELTWIQGRTKTLVMTYGDSWTWAEHFAVQDRAQRMMNAESSPIHIIVDVSNVMTPPERILVQLPEIARYTLSNQIKNLIVVGLQGMLETAARVYERAYHRLITVDTLDEALRIVQS